MEPTLLNLGCGPYRLPGFVNIDPEPGADMQLDLTQPLPWPDSSIDGIYSEHAIQRLSQAQGIALLHECRRVLKTGGVLRISTPDLAETVRDYVNDYEHPEFARFGMAWTANRCERLNMSMRWWGHQWVYDEEELTRLGRMAGLKLLGRYAHGESPHVALRGLEHRQYPALILEFQKPQRRLAADEKPLVTIAIPAYNPRFFRQALESAAGQTYDNLDILVCDDCAGTEIEAITAELAANDPRIRYHRNPPETARKLFGRCNYVTCYRMAKADFLKFLNDDDTLAPNCVERLLDCFRLAEGVTLATSKRQQIDQEGNLLPDMSATSQIVETDSIIEGLSLGRRILSMGVNYVGEPTTVLFRKSDVDDIKPDPMSMDRKEMIGVTDVTLWLNLLARGNAIYLTEPLSTLRRHNQQVAELHPDLIPEHSLPGWQWIRSAWQRLGLWKP